MSTDDAPPVGADAAPGRSTRPPYVATAALGDGSLLVLLGPEGDVLQAWWPHPDREPTLEGLTFGVATPIGVAWAGDGTAELDGEADAGVLRTRLHPAPDVTVDVIDVVAVSGPALVRRVLTPETVTLVVRVRPEPGATVVDRAASGTVVAAREAGITSVALVWKDRRVVLAVGAPGTVALDADGATLTVPGVTDVTVVLAFGPAPAGPTGDAADGDADHLARSLVGADHDAIVAARRAADAALLAGRTPTLVTGDLDALDRASVRVLALLTDRATGGTIAGPDCDPGRVRSGGYGYVWPRDLAHIVLAHLAAGSFDAARAAAAWLVRAQSTDGLWEQRHHTDATVGPGWGRQLDETGAVLHAIGEVVRRLGDAELASDVWPCVRAGADALVATLDPATGLPAASFDVWEERFGVHTASAAAIVAGLDASADLAVGRDDGRVAAWRAAAGRVRDGIDRWLWSEADGRFLRSRDVARPDDGGAPVPDGYLRAARPTWEVGSVDPVDRTLDVSLAALVHPYRVLAPDDPRAVATLDAIDAELRGPSGGVGRYVGDRYVGGNPWVLAGLWMGLARRARGSDRPADGLDLALATATPTWLLPEQFDERTLAPRWVVPLAWSHALVMLAARRDPAPPDLARGPTPGPALRAGGGA